jgi:hypothetical protein
MCALLAMLALAAAPTGQRPSSAVIRRAYEAARSSTVKVVGPKGAGAGIIVGAAGEVLTSIDYVGTTEAKVIWEGRELTAKVTLANAQLRVALIEISAPGSFPSAAVKLREQLEEGSQVFSVASMRAKKTTVLIGSIVRPNSKSAPFAETDFAVPPGSPIFDEQGRLIALAVEARGKRSTAILPLWAIKSQLASVLDP